MNLKELQESFDNAALATKELVERLGGLGQTGFMIGATGLQAVFSVSRAVVAAAQEGIAVLERIATAQEATAHELDGAFDQFVAKPLEGLAPRWVPFTLGSGPGTGARILVQANAVRAAHPLFDSPGTLLLLAEDALGVVVVEPLEEVYRLLTGLGPVPKNEGTGRVGHPDEEG